MVLESGVHFIDEASLQYDRYPHGTADPAHRGGGWHVSDSITKISAAFGESCAAGQQQELINAGASAINKGSTTMLAQDVSSLTTLLSGAQGAALTSLTSR